MIINARVVFVLHRGCQTSLVTRAQSRLSCDSLSKGIYEQPWVRVFTRYPFCHLSTNRYTSGLYRGWRPRTHDTDKMLFTAFGNGQMSPKLRPSSATTYSNFVFCPAKHNWKDLHFETSWNCHQVPLWLINLNSLNCISAITNPKNNAAGCRKL